MNINLVAVSLHNEASAELEKRFTASVNYANSIFGYGNGKIHIGEDVCIFNANSVEKTWEVPVWIEDDQQIVSFSQPPIPVAGDVSKDSYVGHVKEIIRKSAFEDFLPNHFGVRKSETQIEVWSDFMGIGRAYYVMTENFFAASNHIAVLAFFLDGELKLDREAVSKYAGAGFFMEGDSPFEGIRRLMPSTKIVVDKQRNVTFESYYDLAKSVEPRTQQTDYDSVLEEMQRVARNLDALTARVSTVYLSGGRDSRMTAGVWLSGGSDARVVTLGTLPMEAEIARELMSRFEQRPSQTVEHVVQVAKGSDVTQPLVERANLAFDLWDGDAAPTNLKRNLAVPTGSAAISIGGVGGEIMHGYHYHREGQLERFRNAENPYDLIQSAYGISYVSESGKKILKNALDRIRSEAASFGLANPEQTDYLYMSQKLRRWGNQALTSTSAIMLSSKSYVRGCFDLSVEDKINKIFPVELVKRALPEWDGIDYYKAQPEDSKLLMRKGLASFQSDPDGFWSYFECANVWPEYLNEEKIGGFLELARADEASYAHESWMNRAIWLEQLEIHRKKVNQAVNDALR